MARQSRADEEWDKETVAMGLAVRRIARAAASPGSAGVVLTDIRFRLLADGGASVLAVLKGQGADGLVVGFVGAYDFERAVLSCGKALRAGAVKWREDRPWAP